MVQPGSGIIQHCLVVTESRQQFLGTVPVLEPGVDRLARPVIQGLVNNDPAPVPLVEDRLYDLLIILIIIVLSSIRPRLVLDLIITPLKK
ncbi:MAG: hypothetical protein RDV00_09855 [Clostridia bacterium]|nr:hypothetical protein [Clostridia bacterium]